MDEDRWWFEKGYRKGASGRYGAPDKQHFVAVLSSCIRGGIVVFPMDESGAAPDLREECMS